MKIDNSKTLIGKGFRLEDTKHQELVDIYFEDNNRPGHCFVGGATRIGKTRLIEAMVHQDITKGHSIVIVDPKVDWELFARVYDSAKKVGREKQIMLVSPLYPELSNKINICSNYFMEDELINHVTASIPVGGDKFYYDVAYEVASCVVRSKIFLRKLAHHEIEESLSFKEIADSTSHKGLSLLREILSDSEIDVPRSMEKTRDELISAIDKVLETSADHLSKISKSLQTTLTRLTTGNTGIIMNDANNAFIEKLENDEQVILYVQTGAMLTKDTSSTLGRIIASMIQSLSGRLYAQNKKLKHPLCVYMDEFSNVVYMGIEDLINKAGGSNIWLTALTQTFADVIAEVGQDKAQKIIGNMNTQILMRQNDLASATIISDMAGTHTLYSGVLALGGSLNVREVDAQRVRPEEIMELQKRWYIYMGFEGKFKGKTPPIEPVPANVVLPTLKRARI